MPNQNKGGIMSTAVCGFSHCVVPLLEVGMEEFTAHEVLQRINGTYNTILSTTSNPKI